MLSNKQQNDVKLILDRNATKAELAVYHAMWSEHCSYKSSKPLLKHLYTKNKHVIHGPGENAGGIDIGDGDKIAFKVESHNHPSYIEPFQGAATGVGGILRAVFTMGFRPISCLNSLHFGSPSLTCNRKILDGVTSGLSNYGNCVGVPTVSSEITFADCYEKNPVVNAMAVGYTNKKVFTSKPSKKGSVYYVGAKTGTTQNASDGWFVGVTHNLVSGAWVGGDDRSIHFRDWVFGQGARTAMPIWQEYMLNVYKNTHLNIKKGRFDKPTRQINVEIDCSVYSGENETDTTGAIIEKIKASDIF